MSLEGFRALTPYLTLVIMVGFWVIGWFLRRLVSQTSEQIAGLALDLKQKIDQQGATVEKRMDQIERGLEQLEHFRLADQKYLHEQYVPKEGFYRTMNRTESAIGRIFKLINELSQAVHQSIGASRHPHE